MPGSQVCVSAAPRCHEGAGVQPGSFLGRLQWSWWSQCPALPSFAHCGGIEEGSPAPAHVNLSRHRHMASY